MKDPISFVEGKDFSKHQRERAVNGFSTFDWWNFNEYIAYVIVGALEKFKNEGHGSFVYPDTTTETHDRDVERTQDDYNTMIEGFTAFLDYEHSIEKDIPLDEMKEKLDKALELFKQRFFQLWD